MAEVGSRELGTLVGGRAKLKFSLDLSSALKSQAHSILLRTYHASMARLDAADVV